MPENLTHLAVRDLKTRVTPATWSRLRRLAGRRSGPAKTSWAHRPTQVAPDQRRTQQPSNPRWQQRRERRLAMDLTHLAQEFGTDKWGVHRYTPHYQRHLAHLKQQRFTLLEIGIGGATREGGASLRMWKGFFPRARIVGLGIVDKSFFDEPRICTFQGSQVDAEVLHRIVEEEGAPIVVIDDGGHQSTHIRETFRILFPLLPDGAIYVIEDTQTSHWPLWDGSADRSSRDTTMALVKDLVDGLNYVEFVDSADDDYQPTYTDTHVLAVHCYRNLAFIEKGDNRERTNRSALLRHIAEHGHDV